MGISAVKRSLEIYEQWPFDIIVSTFGPLPHLSGIDAKKETQCLLGGRLRGFVVWELLLLRCMAIFIH